MSGMELLRRLRDVKDKTPFILHSGAAGIDLGTTCRELSAEYFLKGRSGFLDTVKRALAA